MKNIFLFFALIVSGFYSATITADTFGSAKVAAPNKLAMGSIIVGNQRYFNVHVDLNQFTVLGVESSRSLADGANEICGAENITTDKYDAIQLGMSLEQVNQVLGCKSNGYQDTSYDYVLKESFVTISWTYATDLGFKFILVHFSDPNLIASLYSDSNNFKSFKDYMK